MNTKEERFVAEYLIDGNATRAAIRAGYSEPSARQLGYRLLKKVHIRKAVEEGLARAAKKADVTRGGVIQDIRRIFDMAILDGQYSAALRAQDLLGRHLGMWDADRSQLPEPAQANADGPSDIVLARRIMYLLHKIMQRQANGADPAPSLLGVEHQRN